MIKLFESLGLLRLKVPEIYTLLDLVEIKTKTNCPTAQITFNKVTNKYIIEIGKVFYESLDSHNLAGVIEHECMHLLFHHLTDERFENKMVANIAMDSIINDLCHFLKDKSKLSDELLSGVFLDSLNKQYNFSFSVNRTTSKEVYDALLNILPKTYIYIGFDEHNLKDGDGNKVDLPQEIKDIMTGKLKAILEGNEKVAKIIGSKSQELDRAIKEIIKPEYNFRKIFEQCCNKTLKIGNKKTWKKTNRRFDDLIKGSTPERRPNVLILVDTSGSITEEILAKVNYQINYLSKHYDFTVCWGDTRLLGQSKVKKCTNFKGKFIGGGGTDLNFYKKVKGKFDLVIFNTDGYITEIAKDNVKKLFCIFDGGIEVPGYKNICIK